MTAPSPAPDGPYDPARQLRQLYTDADTALLQLVAKAVADTIDHPEQQPIVEARLRRQTRAVADQLTIAAVHEIDRILDAADLEGATRADE